MNSQKTITKAIEDLGADIAAFRLSRNMTQKEVADQAGVAPSTLVRLEAGENPTVDTLIRVLRVLDLGGRIGTLVPEAVSSPLDPRSVKGPRKRAHKPRDGDGNGGGSGEPWTWGE